VVPWKKFVAFVVLCCAAICPSAQAADQDGPAASEDQPASATEETAMRTNSIGMKLVEVPAGEFKMGNHESLEALAKVFPKYEARRFSMTDEYPLHRVKITKAFYCGAHEVTRGQFKQFVEDVAFQTEAESDGSGGWGYSKELGDFEGRNKKYSWLDPGFDQEDNHPVVNVTWNDAIAFCQWLGKKEDKKYRLPTEAEWEYACRAGTTGRYHFGDNPEELLKVANMNDEKTAHVFPKWSAYAIPGSDGYEFTAPVGKFLPNKFGLHDMHGNVWEWCSDWYGEDYYANSPAEDPKGPETGRVRIRRGGSWHSWGLYVRSAFRNWNTPQTRYVLVGFRVVQEKP